MKPIARFLLGPLVGALIAYGLARCIPMVSLTFTRHGHIRLSHRYLIGFWEADTIAAKLASKIVRLYS